MSEAIEAIDPRSWGSSVALVAIFIRVAGFLFISEWGFVAWGAYRELNGLSKARSFVELIIKGVFRWAIGAVMFFVSAAMTQA